jgi:hypothetical protein
MSDFSKIESAPGGESPPMEPVIEAEIGDRGPEGVREYAARRRLRMSDSKIESAPGGESPPMESVIEAKIGDRGPEGEDAYMEGVREFSEGYNVLLSRVASTYCSPGEVHPGHPGGDVPVEDGPRWVIVAYNQAGNDSTQVDLGDLLRWLAVHRPDLLSGLLPDPGAGAIPRAG